MDLILYFVSIVLQKSEVEGQIKKGRTNHQKLKLKSQKLKTKNKKQETKKLRNRG